MIFLPPALTANANRYVVASPPERNPSFPKKDFAGAVVISGSILRYSTTSAVPNA